jgi:hypothetical protein
MCTNRINLDDQTLLSLYNKFHSARRSLGEIYRLARYDDFVDWGRYGATVTVYRIPQAVLLNLGKLMSGSEGLVNCHRNCKRSARNGVGAYGRRQG